MARGDFNGALGLTWLFYIIFAASVGLVRASGSSKVETFISIDDFDDLITKKIYPGVRETEMIDVNFNYNTGHDLTVFMDLEVDAANSNLPQIFLRFDDPNSNFFVELRYFLAGGERMSTIRGGEGGGSTMTSRRDADNSVEKFRGFTLVRKSETHWEAKQFFSDIDPVTSGERPTPNAIKDGPTQLQVTYRTYMDSNQLTPGEVPHVYIVKGDLGTTANMQDVFSSQKLTSYVCEAGRQENSEGTCDLCPEDTYSGLENSCKPCPEEGNTAGIRGASSAGQCVCTHENKQIHAESETCVYVGYQITSLSSLRIKFEETVESVPWTVGSKTFNFDQYAQQGFTILAKVSLQNPGSSSAKASLFSMQSSDVACGTYGSPFVVQVEFRGNGDVVVFMSTTSTRKGKGARQWTPSTETLTEVDFFVTFDVSTLTVTMKLGTSATASSVFDSGLGYEDYDQERTLDLIHVGGDCTTGQNTFQDWATLHSLRFYERKLSEEERTTEFAKLGSSTATEVEPCPVNTYKEATPDPNCKACPSWAPTTASTGSATRQDCLCTDANRTINLYETGDAESACVVRPGFYSADGVISACPPGTFNNQTDATSFEACTACDTGYTAREAATDVSECVEAPCALGQKVVSAEGQPLTCEDCPSEFYADEYLAPDCKPCPYSYWTRNLTGQAACEYACNTSGSSFEYFDKGQCASCPPNYIIDYATTPEPTSRTSCTCRAGFYKQQTGEDGDLPACEPCPSGNFSAVNNATECEKCPHSHWTRNQTGQTACEYQCDTSGSAFEYFDLGACKTCPMNSIVQYHITQEPNSREACKCIAGFHSVDSDVAGHSCEPCDIFSYKAQVGNTACTPCPSANEVTTSPTANLCSAPCDALEYLDRDASRASHAAECRTCPENSVVDADKTGCECNPGYQNITTDNGTFACELCPFASWKNKTGNEQCTPCHAFLNTTDRGRTEEFDCECSPGTYQGNIAQLDQTKADIWMNKQRRDNNELIQWTDTCSEPFQIDQSEYAYPREVVSPGLETMMKVVKEHPQIYWMGNTNNLWYAWSAFNQVCDADHNSPTVCERMNECINDGFEDDGRCLCSYNVYTPNDHESFTTSIRRQEVLTTGNVVHNDGEFVGSQDICYQGSNNYIYIRPHWIFNHTKDTNVLRSCTEHDEGKEGNGWVRHEVTTNDGTSLPATFSTDWIPSFIYDPGNYPQDKNYPWDSYCPNCPKDWAGHCFFNTGELEKTEQCDAGNDDPACQTGTCAGVQEQGHTFKEQRQVARVNAFRQQRIDTLYREWNDTLTADQCTVCPAGKFKTTVSNHEAQCQDCPVGKYNPETGSISSDACLECAPGTYQPAIGQSGLEACRECPDNSFSLYYGATNRSGCNCTAGYHGPGGDACDACASGKFKAENGSGTCVQCDKGQQSDEGSAKCTDCPAGKYSIDGEYECYSCSAGVYTPQAKMTTCLQCQAGQRSENSVRSTTCVDCSPGTTSTPPDLSEWEYTPGEVPGNASHICEPCAAGSYNPHFGSPACTLCGKGKYNPDLGSNSSAACLTCAAGTFNGHEGQAACVECFKGSYSEPGSTEFTDCHCAAGSQDDSWAFQHTNGLYYMKLDPEKNFVDNGAARTEWSALRLKDPPSLDATSATVLLNDYTFAQKGTQSLAGVERDDTFFQHSNGHWYMKVNPDENWSERSSGSNRNQRTYFHAVRLLKKPSREDDEVMIVTNDFTFATGARNQNWMSALNSYTGSWWHDAWFKIDLTDTPLTLDGSSQPTCCFGSNAKSGYWVSETVTEFTATMNAGGDYGYTCIDGESTGASNEYRQCAYPLYTYHSV